MEKIGIFCAASEGIDPKYFDSARRIGQWIGETRRTLIYGGSATGLMECVAAAAKQHGATVIGVVPSMLKESGKESRQIDRAIYVRNLSERKDVMTQEADILVALPGGVGTLDEVFHVMAAAIIGYHCKQVVFYNEYGFYDELLQFLTHLEQKGFARQPFSNYYKVASTLEELKDLTK